MFFFQVSCVSFTQTHIVSIDCASISFLYRFWLVYLVSYIHTKFAQNLFWFIFHEFIFFHSIRYMWFFSLLKFYSQDLHALAYRFLRIKKYIISCVYRTLYSRFTKLIQYPKISVIIFIRITTLQTTQQCKNENFFFFI